MAVDEVLLGDAAQTGRPTLRLYAWSEPTLSLGYFQTVADRASHAPSKSCAIVRRSTGGGAILHHYEWTYSLAWPTKLLPAHVPAHEQRSTTWLYRTIHAALATVINRHLDAAGNNMVPSGQPACSLYSPDSAAPSDPLPFLCFLRRSPGDLLLGTTKIAGSAQRRRHGVVLQHGSILWDRSACAPELPGIADLSAYAPARDVVLEDWIHRLADSLEVRFELAPLTDHEARQASEFVQAQYGSEHWTHRR